MRLDLLAIGAHPDDVELSCGGWLARAASEGRRVGVLDLTRGERATNGTVEERAAEADAAAKVLGLVLRENLELPDGALCSDDRGQLSALVSALRRLKPRALLAPWVEARHPDHAAAGRLAEAAVFFAGVAKFGEGEAVRPERLVFYPARREVKPSFVVDVSDHYAVKTRAIQCHASQFARDPKSPGAPTFINAPLGLEAFAVRDRYWGASIGVRHAEPYLIRGPVPLSDPLSTLSGPAPTLVPA